jgi:hypothetical protein
VSANGYILQITTRSGGEHSLCAYWPAPYFVLVGCDSDEPRDQPILYHAESLGDAQRFSRSGGIILNSDFTALLPDGLTETNVATKTT